VDLLFLDLDGVLNAHDYDWMADRGPHHLNEGMCRRLDRMLGATGASIVLSSAWRYHIGMDRIEVWLRERGATRARVVGRTPMGEEMGYELGPIPFANGHKMWLGEHRGREIQAYLDRQPGVRGFAIVEDAADLGGLEHRCVRTKSDVGLQDEHVDRLIALLEGS